MKGLVEVHKLQIVEKSVSNFEQIYLIAIKRKERYCDVVRHVRTRIRFARC